MRGNEKLYLIRKLQIINIKETMKLENHHLANVMVLTDLIMDYQWMLKVIGENLMRSMIFTCLKAPLHKILIQCLLINKYIIVTNFIID